MGRYTTRIPGLYTPRSILSSLISVLPAYDRTDSSNCWETVIHCENWKRQRNHCPLRKRSSLLLLLLLLLPLPHPHLQNKTSSLRCAALSISLPSFDQIICKIQTTRLFKHNSLRPSLLLPPAAACVRQTNN